MWSCAPHGFGCYCVEPFDWPTDCATVEDLAELVVLCRVRKAGGFEDHGLEDVKLPIVALVLASEWVLTQDDAPVVIGGCPVTRGSPFGVIAQTSLGAFVAGSILEIDIPEPERYKRGKGVISVLIAGFYCAKKQWISKGATWHVSVCCCYSLSKMSHL